MAKQRSVDTRGIGLELQRLRRDRKLTCKTVGTALDTSASTISRIETGKREPTREEVASILTLLGVVGVDRARLIEQARRQNESDLVETAGSTEQSRNYTNFEQCATKITDFELALIPGLAQTREYAREILATVPPCDNAQSSGCGSAFPAAQSSAASIRLSCTGSSPRCVCVIH